MNMDNNHLAIESFIAFCDDMMIVEEGVMVTVLGNIQKLFARLILALDEKIKTIKDGKSKKFLQGLLKRAKNGLAKCKSLKEIDPDIINELKNEADDVQKSFNDIENISSNKKEKKDDKSKVQQEEYIPKGKEIYIHSRNFNNDFQALGFSFPDEWRINDGIDIFGDPKEKWNMKYSNYMTKCKKVASDIAHRGEDSPVNTCEKLGKSYLCGIGGCLHIIQKKYNISSKNEFKDRVGRKCLAFIGFLTTQPYELNQSDIEMLFDIIDRNWNESHHDLFVINHK